MTWDDGSVYKGLWAKGVQNGIGMMVFNNNLKKAGIFHDNIMVEMITNKEMIEKQEKEFGKLPAEFKLDL